MFCRMKYKFAHRWVEIRKENEPPQQQKKTEDFINEDIEVMLRRRSDDRPALVIPRRMRFLIASSSCLSDNSMYLCYKHKPIRVCITHTLPWHGKWCLASKISFMESEEEETKEVGERPRKKHFPNPLMLQSDQWWKKHRFFTPPTPQLPQIENRRLNILKDGSHRGSGC